jgi:ferritin
MNVEINGVNLYEAIREHCEINVLLITGEWIILDRQESVETSNMWYINDDEDEVHFTIDDVLKVEI